MGTSIKRRTLRQALRAARTALARDPNGGLPLPQRRAVWLAMGLPHSDAQERPYGLGWRRRVRLSLRTVQHLLPLWEHAYPGDTEPHALLSLAQQVFADAADLEEASASAAGYWNSIANLGAIEDPAAPPDTAFLVGCAAACVVQTACYDSQTSFLMDLDEPNWDELDTDRDAWMWDESYLSAMAAAGGDIWTSRSSKGRRREFWLWWLGYAVPQACGLKVK